MRVDPHRDGPSFAADAVRLRLGETSAEKARVGCLIWHMSGYKEPAP